MKKIFTVLLLLIFAMLISSCGSINKKVIPNEQAPAVSDTSNAASDTSKNVTPKDNKPEENNNTPSDSPDKSSVPSEQSNVPKTIDSLPPGLSNQAISAWMPARNKEHKVPVLNPKFKNVLDKYNGYFTGDTSSKVIYLTFDEGYEYKYTGKILDTLKANDVKATFFVIKSYITKNPELVKRMVDEGHAVGNHTTSHPIMPDLLSQKGVNAVVKELTDTADCFKQVTGKDMPKLYRPPEGVWSESVLYITNKLGYKTILWSIAHRDWDVNNQPGKAASLQLINDYYHNGAIVLLHPQSQSNTEALDEIIKSLKSKGYSFEPLTALE